jgi:hypothetical protein
MTGLRVTDGEDRKKAQGGRRQGRIRLKGTYEKAIGDTLSIQAMREASYEAATHTHSTAVPARRLVRAKLFAFSAPAASFLVT